MESLFSYSKLNQCCSPAADPAHGYIPVSRQKHQLQAREGMSGLAVTCSLSSSGEMLSPGTAAGSSVAQSPFQGVFPASREWGSLPWCSCCWRCGARGMQRSSQPAEHKAGKRRSWRLWDGSLAPRELLMGCRRSMAGFQRRDGPALWLITCAGREQGSAKAACSVPASLIWTQIRCWVGTCDSFEK